MHLFYSSLVFACTIFRQRSFQHISMQRDALSVRCCWRIRGCRWNSPQLAAGIQCSKKGNPLSSLETVIVVPLVCAMHINVCRMLIWVFLMDGKCIIKRVINMRISINPSYLTPPLIMCIILLYSREVIV